MANEETTLKDVIEKIIKDAFARINYAYQHHREGINKNTEAQIGKIKTRLVFPQYFDKENQEKSNCNDNNKSQGVRTRISEQELRFAFVEAFNTSDDVKELRLFYSIEAPTKEKYSGFSSSNKMKLKPDLDPDGQSGEFDLVILNEHLERVCLIEFKANNASPRDHEKDLLKLKTEGDGILRYFIEVVKAYSERDTDNRKKSEISTEEDKKNKTTIESLQEKFKWHNDDGETIIKCYALEGKSVRNKKEGDKKGEDISDKFNK